MQGMIALTLSRSNQMEIPKLIVRGLEENSLYSEEMEHQWMNWITAAKQNRLDKIEKKVEGSMCLA